MKSYFYFFNNWLISSDSSSTTFRSKRIFFLQISNLILLNRPQPSWEKRYTWWFDILVVSTYFVVYVRGYCHEMEKISCIYSCQRGDQSGTDYELQTHSKFFYSICPKSFEWLGRLAEFYWGVIGVFLVAFSEHIFKKYLFGFGV